MSQLHQMQLSFVPLQDRLLLRMNTVDKVEYKLWLTRRYVKLLWVCLMNMSETFQTTPYFGKPSRPSIFSLKPSTTTSSEVDFDTAYNENIQSVFGEEPILVSKVSIKQQEDGRQLLCMHPEEGQGIEMTLDEAMLYSLCTLILNSIKNNGWDLNLKATPLFPTQKRQIH